MQAFRVCALTVLAVVLFSSLLVAEMGLAKLSVQGTLVGSNGGSTAGYWVELVNAAEAGRHYRTQVEPRGRFELYGVAPGMYDVRVMDAGGTLVKCDVLRLKQPQSHVRLEVPTAQPNEPVLGGTVSLARLQHKVPKKAIKEFRRSSEASGKGDAPRALRHLEKAVEIDSEFFEARINLGAAYVKAGRPADALPHFEKAVEMDPSSYMAYHNLGMALATVGHDRAAERAARRAIQLNPASDNAHYLLGAVLSNLGDYRGAMKQLRRAVEAIPQARIQLAVVYSRNGMFEEAIAELHAFLELGVEDSRAIAQRILARIERETGRALQTSQARSTTH